MSLLFCYIAGGKLYSYCDGNVSEIRSGVLDSYITKVKESAARNEWKHSGSGAAFTGAFVPRSDAESRVKSIFSRITCASKHGTDTVYSLTIDNTTGIYKKSDGNDTEGVVISSGNTTYHDFDIKDGRMVVTAAFAGESHIGVIDIGNSDCKIFTEGASWDSQPVWSAINRNRIYFCCAGLPIDNRAEKPPQQNHMDYNHMMMQMFTEPPSTSQRGPSSICLLDISEGSLDEILSDNRFDYTRPQSLADGSLYYIKKPYSDTTSTSNPLGCLGEILMVPIKLLGALFGFFNVFSAKYSGKTLSKSFGTKNRDEDKMFIEGNLINAEAELRANRNRGEKNPGIIPHTWELRRLDANGNDTLIRRGVVAYRVDEASGNIIFSNGSSILMLDKNGKEEKLTSAAQVTFIR